MQAPSESLGQVTDSKVVAEGQKSGKKKARKDLRLVRFGAADGSVIVGLVPPSRMVRDGSVKSWEFNRCYRIKDVDKVGRLSVVREIRGDEEDLPPDLQRFEQVEEVEDDPRIPAAPVMSIENLRKWYPLKRGFFETVFSKEEMNVKAVDDVSFELEKGEIFALAGESGSGKTTLGKVALRLVSPSGGNIFFLGRDITKLDDKGMKPLRRQMQIVFQDPFESLDPRMIIKEIIAEPLRVQGVLDIGKDGKPKARKIGEAEVEERVKKMLSEVELVPPEEFLYRFPHEMSGGQRQRVAVARAFVLG